MYVVYMINTPKNDTVMAAAVLITTTTTTRQATTSMMGMITTLRTTQIEALALHDDENALDESLGNANYDAPGLRLVSTAKRIKTSWVRNLFIPLTSITLPIIISFNNTEG